MFAYRASQGTVDVAFTDRHGGTSGGPFASLDLAGVLGDDGGDGPVRENLDRVVAAFTGEPRAPLVAMRQVHGADVHAVEARTPTPEGDGLVTAERGLTLLVRVADCVPVLLADPERRGGRRGARRPAGSGRRRRPAWRWPRCATSAPAGSGPGSGRTCAGAATRCPTSCARAVAAVVPEAYAETSWGTPALDLGAGVRAQLVAGGVAPDDLVEVARCTLEDDDLFSYRRQGTDSGRLGRPGPGAAVSPGGGVRRDELAATLATVRERIASACATSGRSPEEVTLTVVTKFFPASDVRLLAGLGVTHVGENRHQEAQAKAAACADLELTWHFIGGLQSNKAAAVAAYADVVESVDRAKLLRGLSRGAHERDRSLDVLVQVDLDPDPRPGSRRRGPRPRSERARRAGGAPPTACGCAGVMAVAPLGGDPVPAFAKLARLGRPGAPGRPRGDLGLGRDERRPGGRRRIRRDTRADRQRGAR